MKHWREMFLRNRIMVRPGMSFILRNGDPLSSFQSLVDYDPFLGRAECRVYRSMQRPTSESIQWVIVGDWLMSWTRMVYATAPSGSRGGGDICMNGFRYSQSPTVVRIRDPPVGYDLTMVIFIPTTQVG